MIKKVYCLMPVYNDWESFSILISKIHKLSITCDKYYFHILAVNDGSTENVNYDKVDLPTSIIDLKINIGHQRAIAVGIQYVFNEIKEFDYLAIMDSDGEDNPDDLLLLIEKAEKEKNKIIFAQRKKRHESLLFKASYFIYKNLFNFLTGQKISFGNFSIIPKELIQKVAYQKDIWNHYSGGIIQSKIPFDKILLNRGKRYKGFSKMNFNNLILHGLSSISVYFDYLTLKILRFSFYGILLCFVTALVILIKKYITGTAISGWASSLMLIVIGIVIQLFSVTLIVLLMQLSSRKNVDAPNSIIYKDFIDEIRH